MPSRRLIHGWSRTARSQTWWWASILGVMRHEPPEVHAGPSGYAELGDRRLEEPGAAARFGRGAVSPSLDDDRIGEVLVQVVDVLDPPTLRRPADGDEVEHREVLDHLAQADAAGVRAHRHAELGGEQEDGEVLVDATDPARVDLHDVDRLGLEQLLEDDPVLHVLAGRDPDRTHGVADGAVAEDVVGRRRLLDPVRARTRRSGLIQAIASATPQRWLASRAMRARSPADSRATCEPADVGLDVGADLQLEHREPVVDRLADQARHLARRRSRANRPTSCRRRVRRPRAWRCVGHVPSAARRRIARASAGVSASSM